MTTTQVVPELPKDVEDRFNSHVGSMYSNSFYERDDEPWSLHCHVCEKNLKKFIAQELSLQSTECERRVEEAREMAESILPYLDTSTDLQINDLIYRTPAQGMREAADAIERKDAAVSRFRKWVESLSQPKENNE